MTQLKMYIAKAVVAPDGYNKTLIDIVFVPKGKECSTSKIKIQCTEFLIRQAKNVALKPSDITISVKSIPYEYLVVEDKN